MSDLELARTSRVDAWLAQGGVVLASSARAARAVTAAHHDARRGEGRMAWQTPPIFAWDEWVRERWMERNRAGLMLLNPLQEQTVWARGIRASEILEGLQHVDRLAQQALRAHGLLASYAPEGLEPRARLSWTGDAAVFAGWLTEFEARCRREGLISSCLLPLRLAAALSEEAAEISGKRAPVMLVGFDRLLKSQRQLLDVWGVWEQDVSGLDAAEEVAGAGRARFYAASDATQEIEACVQWLRSRVTAKPASRWMVVATELEARRGALERALLASGGGLKFEFSLGVPLAGVGVVRSALMLLRWLSEPLTEAETDWLLTSGYCAADAEEEIALAETMLTVRARGMERPAWSLEAFGAPERPALAPPVGWVVRLMAARAGLGAARQRQSPLEWIGVAEDVLEAAGWPGFRPASSVVFQALERWRDVLDACGSLGFDGAAMEWPEFVARLAAAAGETIFAVESGDAPVQITEPLTSAGQLADGVWFLGADAEQWPGRGQAHPLLPIGLQREAGMPHASPMADWQVAGETTRRLIGSAEEVVFSYARQAGETEMRPSRLVELLAGLPSELPVELLGGGMSRAALSEAFADGSRIRFPLAAVAGGAGTLTRQSLCPFQAFATARLGAREWEPAETGLNARQRGQLLHDVLHRVWGGKGRGGISSLVELEAVYERTGGELTRFVRPIAEGVIRDSSAAGGSLPARFSARLLALEAERLTRLVAEWLDYERLRLPFTVAGTEQKGTVRIAGLDFTVRLDRVDRLADGSALVIDYKSGNVGPSAWRGERPDDVQLPLYASFAVEGELEGLVFGRVRPGNVEFCGRVRNAASSLLPGLSKLNGLVRDPLTDAQVEEWRELIEALGRDFLTGNADVDPKDPVQTCERCHLHAICRIGENQPLAGAMDGESSGLIDDPGGNGDA
jgi:ATP-dependent helicase/nuclease subunit B